ncbi:uncharacterized protein LOC112573657 [Pomacea canaliculata]|uniref:uncharacterized protein LOC112573657 n=1 Tax=Pomacea canaliculata TaxID=400727 RepID=UPI000D73912D|nr:uncharacterized protein LOC112573657 [Pomacea canaliculata]
MGIREAGAITSLVPAGLPPVLFHTDSKHFRHCLPSEQNTRLCLLHKEGQSSCRSTSETESRDTVLAELLVATRVLQKVMDHVTVLVSVRLWCLLMTSLDGTGATTFQSLGGTGSRTVISQEKTIQARSTIECAVLCRRFPYCISFT